MPAPTRRRKAALPAPDAERASPKLAEQVAARIEKDIIRRSWKVGELLGSEADLVKRYGTSRWVMREAISIAEHDGLVEIRRGRHGGIAVAAPALDTIGSSIRGYLNVSRVSGRHLTEARALLESLAMSLAAARLDDARIAHLRAVTARAQKVDESDGLDLAYQLLHEILSAAGNEALTVFAYALSQVTADMALRRGVPEKTLRKAAVTVVEFRCQQIESIIAFDRELANRLVREHLDVMGRLVSGAPRGTPNPHLLQLTRSVLYGGNGHPSRRLKRSEEITLTLQAELVGNNWPEGHTIGSEPGLMERFGVSRSVLREAIRPLERLGVVEMRRGKNSGLKVTRPDPQSIIRSVVLYLNYAGIPQQSVEDILRVLELSAVSSATALPASEHSQRIAPIRDLAAGQLRLGTAQLSQAMRQFYVALAQLSPNPVIELLMRILGGSFVIAGPDELSEEMLARSWQSLRERISALLDAIEAGDGNLARRRMMELHRFDAGFGTAIKSPEDVLAVESLS